MAIYAPRCMATGITVTKSLESSRKIMLRRGEMMQVISNLITNAMYSNAYRWNPFDFRQRHSRPIGRSRSDRWQTMEWG